MKRILFLTVGTYIFLALITQGIFCGVISRYDTLSLCIQETVGYSALWPIFLVLQFGRNAYSLVAIISLLVIIVWLLLNRRRASVPPNKQ